MIDVIGDVDAFHERFGLTRMALPTTMHRLPMREGIERLRHLGEELKELSLAVATGDLAAQADALVDIVYVAVGTARMQGIPFDKVWRAVHQANMAKAVSASDAKHVVKPEGWQDPYAAIQQIIAEARS
jgi:predicted HAD superfamily Cof-like phosphohydrolase